MASHFRVWLRRKLKVSGKKKHRETAPGGPNPETPAASTRKEPPPPPYATPDHLPWNVPWLRQLPRSEDGSESIEVLRARNPAARPLSEDSPALCPPLHATTPDTAARFAAAEAAIGVLCALNEQNPRIVATRTAQAIAVAISTSRSYAAFIAAITAAKSSAFLLVEAVRDGHSYERCAVRQRNAIRTAVNTAMAADAGVTPVGSWPFDIHDTHRPESSSQNASPPSSADLR